ncbi:hypothetical protein [Streptomyces marianii]|uniref:Uncharacterized protein n=1 Tax=Streptomyces marianii TaxID=1817406 RepID=A0A5R9E7G7_9ACTN|nr:hypothetical protein [Streptomyces marianii]TLQ45786.1 hypothetical protein FEF34_24810 [Streptomyces marianii]
MPSDHDVTTCDSCGSRIRWTVTAAGKRLAVDADPAEDGNTAVYRDGTGRLRSRGLSSERPTLEHAEWLAKPHVATCARPRPPRSSVPRQRTGVRAPHWQGWPR